MYNRKQDGFTIVELLIVIVVIAVLAAITIVAYNGIQNRASDSAVKHDLRMLRVGWMNFHAVNDRYPTNQAEIEAAATSSFKVHKQNYAISPVTDHNLITCSNGPTFQRFSIAAHSKSGNQYYVSESSGVTSYSAGWTTQNHICQQTLSGWTAGDYRGYAAEDLVTGPWRPWTGGN